MSKEAMNLALEALLAATPVKAKDPQMQAVAIVALQEALAEPQQELVAWVDALFDAIKHGDAEHQNWLQEKLKSWVIANPPPTPPAAPAAPVQEPVATGDTLFRQFMSEAEKAGVTHWPTPPAAQPAQPAPVQDVDWKDMYEKEKRRSEMWIAKYEKDIGPLEYAVPVAAPVQEPVGEVNRYGLDSHGRKWHGIYWYDANVDVPHGTKLYTTPPAAQRLTAREIELIDGMIEVQLAHAQRCDSIANRTMADKQKGWDMERVALLQKLKELNA
jgi:hypothetical protein